jgi:hypothetical protein
MFSKSYHLNQAEQFTVSSMRNDAADAYSTNETDQQFFYNARKVAWEQAIDSLRKAGLDEGSCINIKKPMEVFFWVARIRAGA